jgi:para-nitrobenzyl esterase
MEKLMTPDRRKGRLGARAGVAAVTFAALFVCPGAPAGANPGDAGRPIAVVSEGAVRGLTTAAANEFLGLPYAAPPVGSLRWRPPQPAARWSGVRDATRAGSPCPQLSSAFGTSSTNEDCLFLNVYKPRRVRSGALLPVMVWIHGGSLAVGEGDAYDPTGLVRRGVVVVTVNYRLGALGFLAHPALEDRDGAAGNYGLMDQQAALRWVQRDIGAFGGDRRNVTVFGESAGGLSVLSHLVSPASRGLFSKAIVESGNYAPTLPAQSTAEAAGEVFAAGAGCTGQTAACLRSVPVSTILDHQSQNVGGYVPDIDGKVLTRSLGSAFATGKFNRVPVLAGSNRDEWRLIVAIEEILGSPATADNYLSRIQSDFGVSASTAATIAAHYPLSAYPSASVALGAVGTDFVYACTAKATADAVSRYVPTFAYDFSDENAPEMFLPPVSFPYGAAHASELPYLFSRLLGRPVVLTAAQQHLSATMLQYWTSFARHGSPSSAATPFWPPYIGATHVTQSLIAPWPRPRTDFARTHQCDFWSTIR